MDNSEPRSILSLLEGEELSAITFVMDYLQLHFNGPCLNAYVWPSIMTQKDLISPTTPGYRDALCELIGKAVAKGYEEPEESLVIEFVDGVTLTVSLREEDRDVVEAAWFFTADHRDSYVW